MSNLTSKFIVRQYLLSFGTECFVFSLISKNTDIKIHRTVILPVVLYGCETWSLTLREERRLRVFENRVLRIFGAKGDEVTGEWRKLHNEEINDLYCSPNIFLGDKIEKIEMGEAGANLCLGRLGSCLGR
jgi:hypothetical protein